jgi:membrane-associated protease RseP (regulator of RpoE activity)
MAAFALVVAAGGLAAQDKMTADERQRLEQQLKEAQERMQTLRDQMRELERKLGGGSVVLVGPRLRSGFESPHFGVDSLGWAAPLTVSILTDRPRLGVVVKTDIDPATDSIGAVLQAVTPDGPAAKAGLLSGDIVVAFNGEKLGVTGKDASPGDHLIELVRGLDRGDSVRVQYRRGRESKTVVVVPRKLDSFSYSLPEAAYNLELDATRDRLDAVRRAQEGMQQSLRGRLELLPRAEDPALAQVYTFGLGGGRWSDMELTTLDTDLGAYFGTTDGLLVVRAPKDSVLGLKSGDVILRIGGRVPSSASHAIRILRSYEPGDEIRIDVMRNKRQIEVKATMPERERGLFWDDKLE